MKELRRFADYLGEHSKKLERFLDKEDYREFESNLVRNYRDNVSPVIVEMMKVDKEGALYLQEVNLIYSGLKYTRFLEEKIKHAFRI